VQPSQSVNKSVKIGRPGRLETELLLSRRMEKAEHPGVKRLSFEFGCGGERRLFLRRMGAWGFACSTLGRVTHQRVAKMSQMHADLMRAPGFEPAFEKRGEGLAGLGVGAEFLEHPVTRTRGLALAAQDRHALSIEWAPPEIALDQPFLSARASPDDCVVGALD